MKKSTFKISSMAIALFAVSVFLYMCGVVQENSLTIKSFWIAVDPVYIYPNGFLAPQWLNAVFACVVFVFTYYVSTSGLFSKEHILHGSMVGFLLGIMFGSITAIYDDIWTMFLVAMCLMAFIPITLSQVFAVCSVIAFSFGFFIFGLIAGFNPADSLIVCLGFCALSAPVSIVTTTIMRVFGRVIF